MGEGDERALLQGFAHVCEAFAGLPSADRAIIGDVCARMGAGMAAYCGRDLREGTTDLQDYNNYCFVAVRCSLPRTEPC